MSGLHGDIRITTSERELVMRRVPAALGPLWRCIEGGRRPVQMQRSLPASVRAVLEPEEHVTDAARWEDKNKKHEEGWIPRPDIVLWVGKLARVAQ